MNEINIKKIILVFLVFIFFTLMALFSYNYYFKVRKIKINEELKINQGDSILRVLKKIGIKSVIPIKIYLKINQNEGKIKAGDYKFKGTYTIKEIFEIFEEGRYKKIKIVIPEGFTIDQIKERFLVNGLIDEEKFDKVLENKNDFYYYTPNKNFEGYFFPDTYFFILGDLEEKIIDIILNRFIEKYPIEIYKDKKYFYKKLILASIIEREAYFDKEKGKIASVYTNRLKRKMKLQSDPTVQYIYKYSKKKLYYKDLKVKSKYNTYLNYGLPPTPISNPGENAINAAFNPEKTNFLYFFAKENREHYFSETYKEHLKIQKKSKK